ncbi:tRNA lysidine(34) synthetase TilS [Aurantiacibacter sp. MUD11]|uniref:tRNA lysidine(34) synthetase TilS n=1 Tax=Aurantiacibacter sp. MUD11 TaxID=3003265 RepID=UPI0022AA0C00|nr:tRNA lysidine(34) synthetase TilS [Aurantiacibacter sp. MUD11]WAT19195.1 tRNA lysidine(34) synthetase TilS [Aurantiacibacter sp. MUD11]
MGASTASKADLVARFKQALDRLNPDAGKIGLAVSGGPDSMAMLLLAHDAIPGGFEVATVDHGLRPEARDECALVVAACEERGVPCEVLTVEVAEGNVQAKAREARYRALGEWCSRRNLHMVATAHHVDDQAETLLMRLNRGSGVAGLAGVRPDQWHDDFDLHIIRPLLGFRRAELAAVVEQVGQRVAEDPSNADDRFERVRMRQALAGCDWLDPQALAQSASNLAEAYEALQGYATSLWPEMVTQTAAGYSITPGPLREINRRVLAQAMEKMGGRPRGGDVARLLNRLERGEGGNVAGVLAREQNGQWLLSPEPPRKTG